MRFPSDTGVQPTCTAAVTALMQRFAFVAIALLPAWSGASAQDSRDIRVRVGAGAELRPLYPGADTDKVGPLLSVSFAHGTAPFKFRGPDDSAGIALVSSRGFSFGPAANLVSSRRDSDVGAPVGRVPPTVEAGVFAGYRFGDYRVRGEFLKGIGGHEGVRAQLGVDRIWRDGDRYVFSVGPRRPHLRRPLPARLFRGYAGSVARHRAARLQPTRRHLWDCGGQRRDGPAGFALGLVRLCSL